MTTISKQQAVERLARTAIRMFLLREDELATHLVASSASKITMDLCEKKSADLNLWKIYIRPEHHNDFFKLLRSRYNFLKHADRDSDDVIEIKDLREINCFEILLTMWHYEILFGKMSVWEFYTFFAYVIARYSDWIKTETFSEKQKDAVTRLEATRGSEDPDIFFEKQVRLVLEHRDEIKKFVPEIGL